jgi:hypothetical protein
MKVARVPISDCPVCRDLSTHNYADLRDSRRVPAHLRPLVGEEPTARPAEDFIECAFCGTFYAYTYTCGFGEDDIELRRVSPTEAGHEPDPQALARDLGSAHEETRGYAAKCLAEYHLSRGEAEEAERLARHADEVVSSAAAAAIPYFRHRKFLSSDE